MLGCSSNLQLKMSNANLYKGGFDCAAIGTVSNVASRLCDEAKPGQILISPRGLIKVEKAVKASLWVSSS